MLLSLVLFVLTSAAALQASSDNPIRRLSEDLDRAMDGLDDADLDVPVSALKTVDTVLEKTKYAVDEYGGYVQAAVGAGLLFHGSEIATTILFAQAMRTTGGSGLKAAAADLVDQWKATSARLKDEAPTLRKLKQQLSVLEDEADDVRKLLVELREDYKKGEMTDGYFKEAKEDLLKELAELGFAAFRMKSGLSKISRLLEVDAEAVKKIGKAAWGSIVACAAAATSETAAKVSLGLGLSTDVEKNLAAFTFPAIDRFRFRNVQDEVQEAHARLNPVIKGWVDTALKSATGGTMVLTAFKRRNVAATLSGTAIGARLVVQGVRFATAKTSPTTGRKVYNSRLADDTPTFAAITASLAAVGLVAQLNSVVPIIPGPRFNGFFLEPFRLSILPALPLERALNAFSRRL